MSWTRIVAPSVLGLSLLGAEVHGQAPTSLPQSTGPVVTDEGKRLLDAACTQCHGLAPITATRNGPGGWSVEVNKMIAWGAQINSEAEARTLIEYLSHNYGPSAGRMETGVMPPGSALQSDVGKESRSIVLPTGKGAELVQGFCSGCHDLGRIMATRRTARSWQEYTTAMLAKGGMSPPPAAVRAISTYLTDHFGTSNGR
jgi:cytochrome c5